VLAVASGGGHTIPAGKLDDVVRNVLATARQLVPEEAADVAAVLPADLRRWWREAVPLA